MENFFDIATPEEIEEYCGYIPDAEDLADRRMSCEKHPDQNFGKLAALYYDRGDETKALDYLDKIQDPLWRLQASMLLYECVPS